MATLEDVWQTRWNAINADIPYLPDAGIAVYWRGHPELGSPLSAELGLDDGSVAQAFANGIVRWSPETGAEQVSA